MLFLCQMNKNLEQQQHQKPSEQDLALQVTWHMLALLLLDCLELNPVLPMWSIQWDSHARCWTVRFCCLRLSLQITGVSVELPVLKSSGYFPMDSRLDLLRPT